jgi:hypothetical protein
MSNYTPDDRRYMTHEERAIDNPRYRGKVEKRVPAIVTCYCGKTVIEAAGRPTGYTCPRGCDESKDRVKRMEILERRSYDMRFSSALRARAAREADNIRRAIERSAR